MENIGLHVKEIRYITSNKSTENRLHLEPSDELLRGFSLLQPSPSYGHNCTAMFISNTLSPGWMQIPCDETISHSLTLCEIENDNIFRKIPFKRSSIECPPGRIKKEGACHRISMWKHFKNVEPRYTCGMPGEDIASFAIFWHLVLHVPTLFTGNLSGTFVVRWNESSLTCLLTDSKTDIDLHLTHLNESHGVCDELSHLADGTVCSTQLLAIDTKSCFPGHFICADGTCILSSYYCDGAEHCPDSSDEATCAHVCSGNISSTAGCFSSECRKPFCQCYTHYFQCSSGGCVPWSHVCDLISHCMDGSDESWCNESSDNYKTRTFKHVTSSASPLHKDHGIFLCGNGSIIPVSLVNDRIPDCPHTSLDEELFMNISTGIHALHGSCRPDYIPCIESLSRCFPISSICTLEWNEYGHVKFCRTGRNVHKCRNFECPTLYKCPLSYCIPFHLVCDGQNDCPNGEDEMDCTDVSCPGLLKCHLDNLCVHPRNIGDFITQCSKSGDDEELYQKIVCPHTCRCMGQSMDCSQNVSSTLPVIEPEWKALNLSHGFVLGKIMVIHFPSPNKLLTLDLSHNAIKALRSVVFSNLWNLLFLHLHNNNLTYISNDHLLGLYSLHHINLLQNPLVTLGGSSFLHISKVLHIDLSGLKVNTLMPCNFRGLANVLSVNLSYNRLRYVESKSFCALPKVQFLDLRGNDLMGLSPNLFADLKTLKIIRLDQDSLCCVVSSISICNQHLSKDRPSCRDMINSMPLRVMAWVIALFILCLNTGSLVWWKRSSSASDFRIVMLGLSISDIIMGFALLYAVTLDGSYHGVFMAFYGVTWRNNSQCVVILFLYFISFQTSMMFLTAVVLLRFYGVFMPFRAKQTNSLRRPIFATIGFHLFFTMVLGFFLFMDKEVSTFTAVNFDCSILPLAVTRDDLSIPKLILLSYNSIFIIIAIVFSVMIVISVQQQRIQHDSSISSRDRRRITILIVRIFSAVGSCCAPYLCLVCFYVLVMGGLTISNDVGELLTLVILPLGAYINPFLYTFATSQFMISAKKNLVL